MATRFPMAVTATAVEVPVTDTVASPMAIVMVMMVLRFLNEIRPGHLVDGRAGHWRRLGGNSHQANCQCSADC